LATSDQLALEVDGLHTCIRGKDGEVHAVDGVSFAIRSGEVFGLAGESGSGKSMTALSIMRLLPYHGRITAGTIRFKGQELLSLPPRAMRDLRGNRIAIPYTRLLFSALPKAVPSAAATNTTKREDSLPSAAQSAKGCAFHARCPHARASCLDGEPPLRNIAPDHAVACFRAPFAAPFAATL
jgi:oligopeptide/dipeptide ABC transporter ATP-binding protein